MREQLRLVIPMNPLGYGMHASAHYKALKEADSIDIKLEIIGGTDSYKAIAKELELDEKEIEVDLSRKISKEATSFILWHSEQLQLHLGKGINIGSTLFETSILKKDEIAGINTVDKICTYSKWGVNVLKKHGFTNVNQIVGPCIPSYVNAYKEIKPFDLLDIYLKDDKIIVSAGKWEIRKGHNEFVKDISILSKTNKFSVFAFWNNIFTGGLTQPVKELNKYGWTLFEQYTKDSMSIYIYVLNDVKIYLFSHIASHIELISLYKRADILATYSSGEGWDLPCVDAIYMGCDIIGTHNTAHEEYSSYFKTKLLCDTIIANDSIWFKGERGNWYPPVFEDRLKKLENILNNTNRTNNSENIKSISHFCSLDEISSKIIQICFP